MADSSALTRQQKQFADLLLENPGMPAGVAYARAYPRARPGSSSESLAARLQRNAKVRAYLAQRREELQKQTEITQERVLREYAALAFLDPIDIFSDAGQLKPLSKMPEQARRAIAGIDHEYRSDGKGKDSEIVHVVKLRLPSKREALRDLATHLGMFTGKGENSASEAIAEFAKLIKPTLGPPRLRGTKRDD